MTLSKSATAPCICPASARAAPRYWPPGHTVKVGEDAEVILFSPQDEHSEVIDHMLEKMSG